MKKTITLLLLTLHIILSPLFMPRRAGGFDNEAHKALSERATSVSSLDNFLKTVLGFEFPNGITQTGLAGKQVIEHIQDVHGVIHGVKSLLLTFPVFSR